MGLPARQPLTMTLLSRRMGVEVEAPVVEVEAHGGQAGATRGVEAVAAADPISTPAVVVDTATAGGAAAAGPAAAAAAAAAAAPLPQRHFL